MKYLLNKYYLNKSQLYKRVTPLLFVIVFAGIGSYVIYGGFASPASPIATIYAENMTLPAGASIVTDLNASRGKAVELTAADSSLKSVVNLPSVANSLSVIARAPVCGNGANLTYLEVTVDSNIVISSDPVSTSYAAYTASNINLAAGNHTLSITLNNPNTVCNHVLYVDSTNFYGPSQPTQSPRVGVSTAYKAVKAATSSSAVAQSALATKSSDPASGIDPTTIPGFNEQICVNIPAETTACNQQWFNAINYARRTLDSLPPVNINIANFTALSEPQQEFIMTNIEREDRGLQPIPDETSILNCMAQWGTNNFGVAPGDIESDTFSGYAKNCPYPLPYDAGGTYHEAIFGWSNMNTPLFADYYYMYDDGGSAWGHRHNILDPGLNIPTANGVYTGTAYGSAPGWPDTYMQLFVINYGSAPKDIVYTWNQACASAILTCTKQPQEPNQGTTGGPTGTNIGTTLTVNQQLGVNQYLLSANGQYALTYSSPYSNGVLEVINAATGQQLWTTKCGHGYLVMQSDGNLVQFLRLLNGPNACWDAGTYGLGGSQIAMQNDGNLVMTKPSGAVVWSSKTGIVIDPPPTLSTNQVLYPRDELFSATNKYRFVVQGDGNLVIYNSANQATWVSRTRGAILGHLIMQPDGNLVLYDVNGQAVWQTATEGLGGTHVTMQDDGNLVIQSNSGTNIWSIATGIIHPPPPPPPSTLNAGQALYVNQSMLSAGGRYQLILQPDGNLVDYATASHQPIWQDYTYGKASDHLAMQGDGNLVLYGSGGQVLWYTNTRTLGGTRITLQDDGNLVMFSGSGVAVWSIYTGIINPPPPPPPPPPSTLYGNQCLSPMQSLISASGNYQFIMQPDGNAVVYFTGNHQATWYTNTYGSGGTYFCLGTDGNVVLYNGGWAPIWYTNTQGRGGTSLTMQPDGNLVLRNSAGTPIWSIVTGVL